MSKEKILEESYKNLIKYLDWNIECEKQIKEIISKAIDQTREETIKECIKKVNKVCKTNENLGDYGDGFEKAVDLILNKLKK